MNSLGKDSHFAILNSGDCQGGCGFSFSGDSRTGWTVITPLGLPSRDLRLPTPEEVEIQNRAAGERNGSYGLQGSRQRQSRVSPWGTTLVELAIGDQELRKFLIAQRNGQQG